jgi:hypothetical protein
LNSRTSGSTEAIALLGPVVERFEGQAVGDMEAALTWCRQYAVLAGADARDSEAIPLL